MTSTHGSDTTRAIPSPIRCMVPELPENSHPTIADIDDDENSSMLIPVSVPFRNDITYAVSGMQNRTRNRATRFLNPIVFASSAYSRKACHQWNFESPTFAGSVSCLINAYLLVYPISSSHTAYIRINYRRNDMPMSSITCISYFSSMGLRKLIFGSVYIESHIEYISIYRPKGIGAARKND